MAANAPLITTPAEPLLVVDGQSQIQVDGVAAKIIRMVVEQQRLFNASYMAGALHFHFNGKDQSVNARPDLEIMPNAM